MSDAAFLDGADGVRLRVIPFGARLTHLWVPDRDGRVADIVLGHDSDDDYATMPGYLGATCGRFAGRIDNGRFTLDGVDYTLATNQGPHTLHGGPNGFDRKHWQMSNDHNSVTFQTVSDNGENGFPGRLRLQTVYRLEGMLLTIEMTAETDAPTPINLVNHTYFNLAGSGTVQDHWLQMSASHYLPARDDLLPTGEIRAVDGSVFDFRHLADLGARLDEIGGHGFDHNWCLDGEGVRPAAVVTHPASGRRLELATDQPGLQMYTTGHASAEMIGKGRVPIVPFAGLTLETQRFPNAPNEPGFPSTILRPGETYRNVMELRFSTEA